MMFTMDRGGKEEEGSSSDKSWIGGRKKKTE